MIELVLWFLMIELIYTNGGVSGGNEGKVEVEVSYVFILSTMLSIGHYSQLSSLQYLQVLSVSSKDVHDPTLLNIPF